MKLWISLETPDGRSRRTLMLSVRRKWIRLFSWHHGQMRRMERWMDKRGVDTGY